MKLSESLPSSNLSLALASFLSQMPELPTTIRYRDDFDEVQRTIKNFNTVQICELNINGQTNRLSFACDVDDSGLLVKQVFSYLISQDIRISTIHAYLSYLSKIRADFFSEIINSEPYSIRSVWERHFAITYETPKILVVAKIILGMMCTYSINSWSAGYLELISHSLPLHNAEKFKSVKSGDACLSTAVEASIVRYLDQFAAACSVNSGNSAVSGQQVAQAGALLCSYLFGMRSIQIAAVRVRDVRIWKIDGEQGPPDVHITFRMFKQRSASRTTALTRRVKNDWASIIQLQWENAVRSQVDTAARFFAYTSSSAVSTAISELTKKITGLRITPTLLRHTAAQRLVDSGANKEEIAEFLGHNDLRTGLVYFDASANQAELVNKALGMSEVYSEVVDIAKNRFISSDRLAALKGDQQVAGVPHGIPISGIGGCSSGQPLCPYNPITSCYGCEKFMPLADMDIHLSVLSDMRKTVRLFERHGKLEGGSPAFMQLRRTIDSIQQVVHQLEEMSNA